jgi:hypothetical protein
VRGARAAHAVLTEAPSALLVYLVWIHMLRTDSAGAAEEIAASIHHERLTHFHDPRRRVGKAFGPTLQTGGAVVWDSYLAFRPGVTWDEAPPFPADWAHQLRSAWADPARFRWKDDLTAWLREAATRAATAGGG